MTLVRAGAVLATAALAAGALAGCLSPSYACQSDVDCDVGKFGRCELDHRCTAIDPTCTSNRRYSDHSGPPSLTCFDDSAVPLDLCAAGQPPAIPTGCVADVCAAVPACCLSGWSEACVQQAQLRCSDLVCDTRIAITATSGAKTELWDLRWSGSAWTRYPDPTRTGALVWLAPAPGSSTPRLAGFRGATLVGDDLAIPITGGRTYFDAASVDFDRDHRSTVALASVVGTDQSHLEILKLDDGTLRDIDTKAATRLAWGDINHDGFPDAIAGAGLGATRAYNLLVSIQPTTAARRNISDNDQGALGLGIATDVGIRGFDWIDLDGDHQLEAAGFGYSVAVHRAPPGEMFGNGATWAFDCAPPIKPIAGTTCTAPEDPKATGFAGAAAPATTGAQAIVLATIPTRGLYRAEMPSTVTAFQFPPSACGASCPPILAVVVRDLDGDHQLDVIAIDANLQVFTGRAAGGLLTLAAVQGPPVTTTFSEARTSVSGAPRP